MSKPKPLPQFATVALIKARILKQIMSIYMINIQSNLATEGGRARSHSSEFDIPDLRNISANRGRM